MNESFEFFKRINVMFILSNVFIFNVDTSLRRYPEEFKYALIILLAIDYGNFIFMISGNDNAADSPEFSIQCWKKRRMKQNQLNDTITDAVSRSKQNAQ